MMSLENSPSVAKSVAGEERTCRACGAELARPFVCSKCGALFKEPPGLDHFAFFGLERAFDLEEAALEKAFLELSRLLHPDRQIARKNTSGESPDARRLRALALSAAMNAGYETLKNPLKRAEYLLRLSGGVGPDKDRRTPPGFLDEMLELREEVERARAEKDRAALEAHRTLLRGRREQGLSALRTLFSGPLSQEALARARVELNALKYLDNIVTELDAALRGE
jgi:molecular chaperone HscB